jgi:hypothetical protein
MTTRSPLLGLLAAALVLAGAAPAHATTASVADAQLKVAGTEGSDHVTVTLVAGSPYPALGSAYRVTDPVAVTAKDGCVQETPTQALCSRGDLALGAFGVEVRGGAGDDELTIQHPPGVGGDRIMFYGEGGNDRLIALDGWHETLDCGEGTADAVSRDDGLDSVSADCENVGPITHGPDPAPCPTYGPGTATLRHSCPVFVPQCATLPASERTPNSCYDPPCGGLEYRPAVGEACRTPPPIDCSSPTVHCDAPRVSFSPPGLVGPVRVSPAGSFALADHWVRCPVACEVTTVVSARLASSAKRAVMVGLGRRAYTLRAANQSAIRGRLSPAGLRQLKRRRSITATVRVTVTWLGRTVTRSFRVTLKAPRSR